MCFSLQHQHFYHAVNVFWFKGFLDFGLSRRTTGSCHSFVPLFSLDQLVDLLLHLSHFGYDRVDATCLVLELDDGIICFLVLLFKKPNHIFVLVVDLLLKLLIGVNRALLQLIQETRPSVVFVINLTCPRYQNLSPTFLGPFAYDFLNLYQERCFLLEYLLSSVFHDLLVNITDDCNEEVQENDCVQEYNYKPERPDNHACGWW